MTTEPLSNAWCPNCGRQVADMTRTDRDIWIGSHLCIKNRRRSSMHNMTAWCARCGDGARHDSIAEDERWVADHRCGIYGLLADIRAMGRRARLFVGLLALMLAVWAAGIAAAIMIGRH